MEALSVGKCKSWYVHLVVWVVPLQMSKNRCSLWEFSTSPIEQRGARLKKIVRNCISWRPWDNGKVEDKTNPEAPATFWKRRRYESCAMLQLLRACVAQEEVWRVKLSGSREALSVSEARMQQRGRTTIIKSERGCGSRLKSLVEEIVDLSVE